MNRPHGNRIAKTGVLRAAGAMSGTSLDGVDVAVIDTDGRDILGFGTSGYREYSGEERRKKAERILHYDRRKSDKVHSSYVMTKGDERYQFEHLVIYYRATFIVWQVMDYKRPSYDQILFEVVGYSNQGDVLVWTKDYIKAKKEQDEEKENDKRVSRTKPSKRS